MKHDEAKRVIQESLENPYDSINFSKLIANVLTTPFKVINNTVGEAYVREAFRDSISSYTVIWTYEDPANKRIAILEVRLKNTASLQNARTMQRNFVADFLKWGNAYGRQDGALVAFVSPNPDDWRFSLVKMEYSPEIRDGKIKINEELTPAKRWSFLVWKHEKSHTAQSRFLPLVMEESHSTTLAEIENAFDVEKVTDEFFEQYKECFFRFKDEIDRIVSTDDTVRVHFESIWLDTANFAKKTLWQIAFLYFLQKKWWFGVASDNDWGKWPKDFLRKLFERKEKYGSNFFNDILEPLFYEALATDRWESAIYTRLNNTRIPFLNGGLFEPMKWYSWETTNLVINDEIFSNTHKTKNGDIGDGIFDVFDRYNFTVSEDEPLEKEVAVDPEMLGKIFENLLEVRDRKSKWAFYTPRPIVHYMCQESLIEYLACIDPFISREEIEFFIRESERTLENDRTMKRKIDEKITQWREYKWEYTYQTPESIRVQAQKLDDALANVRIADPAVWSGAFPLGMINEIVRARQILAVHTGSRLTAYDFKLHAIQESIYGVDLDPGAVEICQLRLWLSLIVDEDRPHPLPNLNYRIVQGNSLIEEYEWIKLYDTKLLSAGKWKVEQMSMDSLMASESNKLYELLQHNLKKFIETSERTKKLSLKKEIDDLKYWLIEATLREQNKEERIVEIRRLREANITPFFLWKLEFSEVFQEKWGFDIVIWNPPYVGEKGNKDIFRPIAESSLGKRFHLGKMDLFYFFFHLGLDLLKDHGVIAFITTNYYITATGAKKLRADMKERSNLLKLINFGELRIFPSALGQHNLITILAKDRNHTRQCSISVTNQNGNATTSILQSITSGWSINTMYSMQSQDDIYDGSENYIRLKHNDSSSMQIDNILDKICIGSAKLGDICYINKWFHSGCDKVTESNLKKIWVSGYEPGQGIFVISKAEFEDKKLENERLHICYKSSNIDNYYSTQLSNPTLYVIYTDKKTDIETFPKIKNHLQSFRPFLEMKREYKNGRLPWFSQHWPREEDIFTNKEKIVLPYRPKKNIFSYCDFDFYASEDVLYLRRIDPDISLKYLTWVLNSKLYYEWLFHRGKRKGDTLELYQEPLSEIPIKVDQGKKNITVEIENVVDEIILHKKDNPNSNIDNLEQKIDALVYKLFELTEEEIAIIEGGK